MCKDVNVAVVSAAHAARAEFEEQARLLFREAVAKIPRSPFKLNVYLQSWDVTTLDDGVRTYIYDVSVKAEIGDGR